MVTWGRGRTADKCHRIRQKQQTSCKYLNWRRCIKFSLCTASPQGLLVLSWSPRRMIYGGNLKLFALYSDLLATVPATLGFCLHLGFYLRKTQLLNRECNKIFADLHFAKSSLIDLLLVKPGSRQSIGHYGSFSTPLGSQKFLLLLYASLSAIEVLMFLTSHAFPAC